MRISDWSSDVCSSDLQLAAPFEVRPDADHAFLGWLDSQAQPALGRSARGALVNLLHARILLVHRAQIVDRRAQVHVRRQARVEKCQAFVVGRAHAALGTGCSQCAPAGGKSVRSEEHTSELQSLMRISYAVFCLKKKKNKKRRDN